MIECNNHKDLFYKETTYPMCPLCFLEASKVIKKIEDQLPPNFIIANDNDIVTENFIYYNKKQNCFYHLKFLDFPSQKTISQIKTEYEIEKLYKPI